MKPKLLMTASSFAHICSFHLPYIEALRNMGWEIHIACGGEPRKIANADRLIQLPLKKSMFALGNFRSSRMLRRNIQREKYELVICHTSLAAFFTRFSLLGSRQRPKTINVVHGYLFDDSTNKLKAFLLKLAERICAPVTDTILTMNQYDYAWAKANKLSGRVAYIPGMGADEMKAQVRSVHSFGFEEDALVLIYPAEFSNRKNQKMLIYAMTKLPDKVKLILPGDGALLEECKSLAEHLSLSGRVVFPGYVKDIASWLKGADIAVSSSRSEGLPFNVIEAMQCRLPVVVSNAKGNADLVQSGINGYIFCNEAEFVAAVNELLSSPETRKRLGENGCRLARKYALHEVFPKVMSEYLS